MKRALRNGMTAAGSLLLVFACNGQTQDRQETIGSETNWLGDCSRTGHCTAGECICGLCTERCTGDDACGGGDTICASNDGVLYQATCGDADPEGSGVCVALCTQNGDCEPNMKCVGGLCTARTDVDASPSADTGPRTRSVFQDQLSVAGPPGGLLGRCLPRKLPVDIEGHVNCVVLEASVDSACDCSVPGRRPASAGLARVALDRLDQAAICRGAECDSACACEVEQERSACDTPDPRPDGWCYVDAEQGIGDPSNVAACRATEKRVVIFDRTHESSIFVIACATDEPSPTGSPSVEAAVGESCVPAEEYDPMFFGFAPAESTVYINAPGCESSVCLVSHFQGRVSCPYGNSAGSSPDAGDCFTPDGTLVSAPVEPQLLNRAPVDAAYCSCRCDGPRGSGPFCECPDGFSCESVIDSVPGLSLGDVAGSYCIKDGTQVHDPKALESQGTCSPPSCDDR